MLVLCKIPQNHIWIPKKPSLFLASDSGLFPRNFGAAVKPDDLQTPRFLSMFLTHRWSCWEVRPTGISNTRTLYIFWPFQCCTLDHPSAASSKWMKRPHLYLVGGDTQTCWSENSKPQLSDEAPRSGNLKWINGTSIFYHCGVFIVF